MRIRGLGRLKWATRRVRNQFAPGGLVLLYHRVAEVPSDPFNLCVTPRHFAEHLEVLKKYTHPVPLQQLVKTSQQGNSPNWSVAITFDDGYADNLYNAKPLLEKYEIPATVFVATGNLEHEREFWWDELDRLLLQPGKLPQILRLNINGSNYEWDLGEAAEYSEDTYQRNCTWSWGDPEEADPSPRQSVYRELYLLLRPLPLEECQKLLEQLRIWSGADSTNRSTHRSLSPEEVSTLEQGSLIEVGAHTVNHPFLSSLSLSQQKYELQQSKTRLEEILEHPVNTFAYPYGDYVPETTTLAREVGFVCACSTYPKKVRRNPDYFEFPRFGVEDWDGEEFAKQLSRWLYHLA